MTEMVKNSYETEIELAKKAMDGAEKALEATLARKFELGQREDAAHSELVEAESRLNEAIEVRTTALLAGTDADIAGALESENVARERAGFAKTKIETLSAARRELDETVAQQRLEKNQIGTACLADIYPAIAETIREKVFDDMVRYCVARKRSGHSPFPLYSVDHLEHCLREVFTVNFNDPRVMKIADELSFR
ncbi:MAG: hypothetical protein KZQ77_06855 [Candidatus Thiodiazotropha sp. (ex Notomyrtea botanica)]|nr:hypothetical protein [Candidatus Thiodiazotropha sp. (ex Notomyrtea botanica)]